MKYGVKQILRCLPCLLLPALLCACGSPYKKSALIEASGQVDVQRANESFALGADTAFRFKEGDLVTSGEGASAWFWLDGYKSILLGPASEMRVSHYGRGFNLGLAKGLLFVRIDKALETSELFEVTTGKVVLSVRGTVFSAQYQSADEVLVNVFQGRVALCEATGGELITAEKGQGFSYDPATGKLKQPAAPIDFAALPPLVAACVADYREQAGAGVANPAAGAESESAPQPAQSPQPGSGPSPGAGPQSQSGAAAGTPAPAVYSVIFDLNGGMVGPVTQPILREVREGQAAEPPGTPERAGYVFEGWFLEPEGKTPAALADVRRSFTAYAGWGAGQTLPPAPARPAVRFKYLWREDGFYPAADIAWADPGEGAFLTWQVYDAAGRATAKSGKIEAGGGPLELTGQSFAAGAPQNGLWPQGYTLRLTACDAAGNALWPAYTMELPYFELGESGGSEPPKAVVSTNLGLYFDHSLQNLSIAWQGDHFEAAGTLYPLQGQSAPLALDVHSAPKA